MPMIIHCMLVVMTFVWTLIIVLKIIAGVRQHAENTAPDIKFECPVCANEISWQAQSIARLLLADPGKGKVASTWKCDGRPKKEGGCGAPVGLIVLRLPRVKRMLVEAQRLELEKERVSAFFDALAEETKSTEGGT